MSNHKFFTDKAEHDDEAGYTVEDGVLVDDTTRPTARKAFDEWSRYWRPTSEEMRAEEAAWAARSGPCVTVKPGRKTA